MMHNLSSHWHVHKLNIALLHLKLQFFQGNNAKYTVKVPFYQNCLLSDLSSD